MDARSPRTSPPADRESTPLRPPAVRRPPPHGPRRAPLQAYCCCPGRAEHLLVRDRRYPACMPQPGVDLVA
eukprot:6615914-Alexandrium_andersonii.AAC.1